MEHLRFALLFNGKYLERWHLRCLDYVEKSATLVGVILANDSPNSPSDLTGLALMRFFAKFVANKRILNVTERFAGVPRLNGDDEQRSVERSELDFVLKLGPGSIQISFRPLTPHGVWFFQHETDENVLPFFREVYNAEDVTEAALLALGGPAGDASLLERGHFRTDKQSYVRHLDHILDVIAEWPAHVCRRFAQNGGQPEVGIVRAVPPNIKSSFSPQFLRFGARIARRRLSFAWNRVFRHPQWNIGVLRIPAGNLLRPGAYSDEGIEWFPLNDRKKFLADPFGIARNEKIHILCEYFGYADCKGHICALEYDDGKFTRGPERAIEGPVHMSYPFLVEEGGEIYCIPETSYADEIALFRATEFPHSWSKVAVLVEHFGGSDATVFRHDGRWWLTCTEKGPDADVKLWIWHAPDLRGPWIAHARNPVKTDVRSARPGGTPFVHDGVLYRPAQDCSKGYGWRISIQRVTALTPSEFVEETVTVLEASPESPFPLGRHTLSSVGELVLVDGHRAVFVWDAFLSFLRIWARDLSGKLRWGQHGSKQGSVRRFD